MQFPWYAAYPADVPTEIDPAAYSSLVARVADACDTYGPKRAFGSFNTYLTYTELDRAASGSR
jgi:long-chain acyl-CoA synthetase